MKKYRGFWEKVRFKYRVSILNENTLEEAWHARLSRFSVFVWTCLFFILTFAIFALLVYCTPIKHYLPGFEDAGVREVIMNEAMRVDSLQTQLNRQQDYTAILRGILSGEIAVDTVTSIDSLTEMHREKVMLEKSALEQRFCDEVERKEQYVLSQIGDKQEASLYIFFKPVRGVITSPFDPNEQRFGITVTTAPDEVVMSVLAGTVVFTDFTLDNGWVIAVQHEDNYLSVYKHNFRLLKTVGESVRAGESIARLGGTAADDRAGLYLEFELWKNGVPVNPEEVIAY